jgi:beta-galactosidase
VQPGPAPTGLRTGPVPAGPARARTLPAEGVPAEGVPAEAVPELDEGERRRISRRALLQAGLIGGAGIAALPLLALIGSITKSGQKPAGLSYPLNSDWLFGGTYQPGAEAASFDDASFTKVTIPHSMAELSWHGWNPATWQQVSVYRRRFLGAPLLGSKTRKNRVFIDFDGVMVNCTVVCNDQVMATHQGGYLPFSVELTNALIPGQNVLSVIVDARALPVPPISVGAGPASIDFMQPGGIYREVSLRLVPQIFISDLFANPAQVLTAAPLVDVVCTIDAAAQQAGSLATLTVELLEDGTDPIASKTLGLSIIKGSGTASLSLTNLGAVKLWSPDRPTLYTVRATLSVPGLGAHVKTQRIGFREATFQPDGFYLNGQRLQLFGLNRHQLYPYTGMAMPARVQRRDAEILRNEFNCNMVRCSHYPQSPHFLDACDELGLLVWEEAPGWDQVSTQQTWQNLVVQNVRDMVTRDRSRPSVIIWGTRLNETPDYPALWTATRQAAKQLDPSRPSSGAMDSRNLAQWDEDVFAFNDYSVSRATGNAELSPPLPGLPYLVTESVGVVESRPQHFAWTDPPALMAKQAALHAQTHNMARSDTRYSGLLAWAGFDYCSLRGGRPANVKWAGVADGFRIPKLGAAIYQAQVDPRTKPVIVPVFFWEPDGVQPPGPQAMIASNCEQLDIFVNGGRVITALPASGSPLYKNLPYPPFLVSLPVAARNANRTAAELHIVGYVAGQRVAEVRMSADPSGDHLTLTADDATITADGTDATRIVFRGVDTYGNQRRVSTGLVTLIVTGPGVLVGDNPFAFGAYGGLGAVWVRSEAGQEGTITVTAAHPALGQAQAAVQSVRPDTATSPV